MKNCSWNLPDDYSMYWRRCTKCGRKFHASDGACDYCLEEAARKAALKKPKPKGPKK